MILSSMNDHDAAAFLASHQMFAAGVVVVWEDLKVHVVVDVRASEVMEAEENQKLVEMAVHCSTMERNGTKQTRSFDILCLITSLINAKKKKKKRKKERMNLKQQTTKLPFWFRLVSTFLGTKPSLSVELRYPALVFSIA